MASAMATTTGRPSAKGAAPMSVAEEDDAGDTDTDTDEDVGKDEDVGCNTGRDAADVVMACTLAR